MEIESSQLIKLRVLALVITALLFLGGCSSAFETKPLVPLSLEAYLSVVENEGTLSGKQSYSKLRVLCRDVMTHLPFRTHMSLGTVRAIIKDNNEKIAVLQAKHDRLLHGFPVHRLAEHNLYIYSEETTDVLPGSFLLFADGKHRFFVDMTHDNGIVDNVYILPGSRLNPLLPGFLLEGTGDKYPNWINRISRS